MIGPQSANNDPKALLTLKRPEPGITPSNPWEHDWLGRRQVAERLMVLLETHDVPFAVSIDGGWGSGKTFMLKRWQQQLENEDYRAIYFNAWEEDFCSDPLLSIIAHLAEYSAKDATISETAKELLPLAFEVVRTSILPIALELAAPGTVGIVQKLLDCLNTAGKDGKGIGYHQGAYAELIHNRAKLTEQLGSISNLVKEQTGKPLVFIIDELDRCRPTYAIELLERVKHIISVPGIVFVFGMNRDELCKALKSVYGEIDADVYLRRFFDMEFVLPRVDTEDFCRSVFSKYGLDEYFRSCDNADGFHNLSHTMVILWSQIGLSLRDINYGARLIALVGKSLFDGQHMNSFVVGILIALKFKNPNLYTEFIDSNGHCTGSTVMDFIDETIGRDDVDIYSLLKPHIRTAFFSVEAALYATDIRFFYNLLESSTEEKLNDSRTQLESVARGWKQYQTDRLSKRIIKSDQVIQESLLPEIDSFRFCFGSDPVREAAELIDLHHGFLRI